MALERDERSLVAKEFILAVERDERSSVAKEFIYGTIFSGLTRMKVRQAWSAYWA